MRRLLITGGAGFIGANFVHHRLAHHHDDRIVVLDALTHAGCLASLARAQGDPRFAFVRGDICDATLVSELLDSERIDCIVHLAAQSHVDRSLVDPDEFVRTNVLGTHVLLKAARAAWTHNAKMRSDVRFHHVSTDEVYGSLHADGAPFTEATAYAPSSPYSASKAAADHLVRAYHRTYGLPVTTSNCSNNYGPYQFPEKLIPLMLVNALTGKRLPVYGRGENVRDWLHVQDHCRALDAVLARGGAGQTYNVGGNNQWRNLDVVHLLCASLQRRFAAEQSLRERFTRCPAANGGSIASLIDFVPDRLGHDQRYAIDAAKIRSELGFVPAERFETGIEKTLDWYLQNEGWWRALIELCTQAE